MPKRHTVELKSRAFGEEYFQYDTKREAEAGLRRLKKAAVKHGNLDGIRRTVKYLGKVDIS